MALSNNCSDPFLVLDLPTNSSSIHQDVQDWLYWTTVATTPLDTPQDDATLDFEILSMLATPFEIYTSPCTTPVSDSSVAHSDAIVPHQSCKQRSPCGVQDCTRLARRGKFCPIHGGTKCCKVKACGNAAQTQGLCKTHGGGPRCRKPGCGKSSQGGGLCRAHGGGKRCNHVGCSKGVQRGNKCATHGGTRLCSVEGCVRMDRGGNLCDIHRKEHKCVVTGCRRLSHLLGKCKLHLRQQTRLAALDKTGQSFLTPLGTC
ncbi:hypothetical protein H310_10304 [Aphanomyces invadans]|uniref:WRKY19-like zinc finger domain-containing protein n=1 Tax=Aphanomyces invadans TaxID=157072 RepID=A0A024TSJ0_9STRA|nr:hypothetical protein H310_10304 [Aphanomyces invadans]ETV96601.1 hypothetical protein H310_10304 [Aphanomyces invadans]|eukprot:XP_008874864.1 hypothetical protein H310_10304 [Aphanomyces invadans]